MSDHAPYPHNCARCGLPVSEKGRLCRDCVYTVPLIERQRIWRAS